MLRPLKALVASGLMLAPMIATLPASAAGLSVKDPWVREAPPGIRVVAAYMTLSNPQGQADRLLAATSPMTGAIEIHRMTVTNGVMDMEAIPFLTVPAKGTVKLRPGGTHLMIYGVKQDLKAGDRLRLVLTFERAGLVTIDAPVRRVKGKE